MSIIYININYININLFYLLHIQIIYSLKYIYININNFNIVISNSLCYKFLREIYDRYQELASYPELDPEAEQMIKLMQEIHHKKKMILPEPENDKIVRKKNNKYNKNARREKMNAIGAEIPTIEEMETDKEDEERVVTTLEAPLEPRRIVKKRRKEILSSVCAEVCKPEICCADLEGKLPFRTTAQTFHRVGKTIYFFHFLCVAQDIVDGQDNEIAARSPA